MGRLKPTLVALGKTAGLVLAALVAVVALVVAVSLPRERIARTGPLEQFFAPIVENAMQTVVFGVVIGVLLVASLVVIWKFR